MGSGVDVIDKLSASRRIVKYRLIYQGLSDEFVVALDYELVTAYSVGSIIPTPHNGRVLQVAGKACCNAPLLIQRRIVSC